MLKLEWFCTLKSICLSKSFSQQPFFLYFKNRILELDILNTPLMIQHFSNKWIDKFCLKKNHDVLLQKNMKNEPP